MGSQVYPEAERLLITADSGGSKALLRNKLNNYRLGEMV
jgi:hypothetical protein